MNPEHNTAGPTFDHWCIYKSFKVLLVALLVFIVADLTRHIRFLIWPYANHQFIP